MNLSRNLSAAKRLAFAAGVREITRVLARPPAWRMRANSRGVVSGVLLELYREQWVKVKTRWEVLSEIGFVLYSDKIAL